MRLLPVVAILLICAASQPMADITLGRSIPPTRRAAAVPHTIAPASTSVTAFVGQASQGRSGAPTPIRSIAQFTSTFGAVSGCGALGRAVSDYFANGGQDAIILSISPLSAPGDLIGPDKKKMHRGLYALDSAEFNLLCIPPYKSDGSIDTAVVTAAAEYCEKRRAILILDPPPTWTDAARAQSGVSGIGTTSANAAVYFPRLREVGTGGSTIDVAPSGAVAGVIARIDAQRGVWKSPAGTEAGVLGISGLTIATNDSQIDTLNAEGINSLRTMGGAGYVVWGAKTIQGGSRFASEWKYLPVRRLALHVERSVYGSTAWTSSEANSEPLWSELRSVVGEFLRDLWLKGAFQGQRPQDAYFVKCDRETTTQDDISQGRLNLQIGFAPLKPAEFVVLHVTQSARKP